MALDTLGFFSRWEDFRSASLSSPADERAQFPRVGRRGKKLERSTRVCRLRRPCTSDRSGQCQRCRSPPPPSKSSPTYAAPCSTPRDRGSSNRRTGSEDTGGIRVTSGSLMTVLSQQESVTVSRNFVRNFASPSSSRKIGIFIRKLRKYIPFEDPFLCWRYDLSLLLLLFYRADFPVASLFSICY